MFTLRLPGIHIHVPAGCMSVTGHSHSVKERHSGSCALDFYKRISNLGSGPFSTLPWRILRQNSKDGQGCGIEKSICDKWKSCRGTWFSVRPVLCPYLLATFCSVSYCLLKKMVKRPLMVLCVSTPSLNGLLKVSWRLVCKNLFYFTLLWATLRCFTLLQVSYVTLHYITILF